MNRYLVFILLFSTLLFAEDSYIVTYNCILKKNSCNYVEYIKASTIKEAQKKAYKESGCKNVKEEDVVCKGDYVKTKSSVEYNRYIKIHPNKADVLFIKPGDISGMVIKSK